MPSARPFARLGSLVIAVVLVAACSVESDRSGGDPTTDDPPTTDAPPATEGPSAPASSMWTVFEQAEELGTADLFDAFSAAERRCIEAAFADVEIDLEWARRLATGLDAEAEEARVDLQRTLFGCVEDEADYEPAIRAITTGLEPDGITVSHDEARCLWAVIVDGAEDPIRTVMVGDVDSDLVLDGIERCFTEENLGRWNGEAGFGPQAYGDDDRFDHLHDDCSDGDPHACDVLYLLSSIDSDYEAFGETCGETTDGTSFCTPGLELDDGGLAVRGDGLDELVLACHDGQLHGCDLLFRVSPAASEAERVGYTCGDRLAVGAVPSCAERLG